MKFSLEAFSRLDLPNFSINIWEYNDEKHKNSSICRQYEKWCIEAAKRKWQDIYMDFDYVIENIKKKYKKFFNFRKFPSANGENICRLVQKFRS